MTTTSDRIPVEIDVTITAEPVGENMWQLVWPGGEALTGEWLMDSDLECLGIPLPKPPRVGPCGMTEAETRAVVDWEREDDYGSTTSELAEAKIIDACRAQVAEWDAEEAAATPEPETVAVVTEIASYKLPWRADGGGHIFDADDVWVADANTAVARWIVDQANAAQGANA